MHGKWMTRNVQMDTALARKSRMDDYWYVLEMAGLVMNWEPRYYIVNGLYVVCLFANYTYFIFCLSMSVAKAPDLTGKCQFLNILALLMIAMITVIIANMKRKVFLTFIEMSGSSFYDYRDTLISTSEIEEWKTIAERIKRIVLVVIPVYLVMTALSIMLADVIDTAFSYPLTNETTINGIYQKIPWKMWFYHDIDNTFVRLVTILCQMFCSCGAALVIGSADLIMFCGGQNLIIQLKILNMVCRDTDRRADKLYEKATGKKPPTEGAARSKNRELMGFYKFCLTQVVEHHKIILQYASYYQELLNWPGGLVVVNGSIVVAMSMLSMMQGGGQPSVLFTSIMLQVAEVASIYVLCEVGETIRNLCEALFDSMYSFEWKDCSPENKKTILIMKLGMKKPFTLMAGSLTPIDRNTFGTVDSSIQTAESTQSAIKSQFAECTIRRSIQYLDDEHGIFLYESPPSQ